MRQYQITDLTREERNNIDNFLRRNAMPGSLDGLFWLVVPEEHLGPVQREHQACGPFYFGVEVAENSVSFELLVRSSSALHCSCIAYADAGQRDYLIGFVERLLAEETIKA